MNIINKVLAFDSLGQMLSSFNGADPSKGLNSVLDFLWLIIKLALDFAGMVAVIMFLWGAFNYVTAYGNETTAETAKKTLIWAVVGLALIALANVNVIIPMLKK